MSIKIISDQNATWLRQFQVKHGRPPRILHIGNIANNAYLNSKILREAGLVSDVLCYDYKHIMGCPEWEECDLKAHWGDDFNPNWRRARNQNYTRPEWFYHGNLANCLMKIRLRYGGKSECLSVVLEAFASHARRISGGIQRRTLALGATIIRVLKRTTAKCCKQYLNGCKWLVYTYPKLERCLGGSVVRNALSRSHDPNGIFNIYTKLKHSIKLIVSRKNNTNCPETHLPSSRTYVTKRCDISPYFRLSAQIGKVFKHYDLIQAYATDPIHPYLLNVKPYVAFEHGTIRSIPFQQDSIGILTAEAYKSANHCFITNCDNIAAARRLNLTRFSFIPHPVNESFLEPDKLAVQLRQSLLTKTSSNFLVLHPSRQHWSAERHPDWEKGNDRFIKGFAMLVQQTNRKVGAVMVDWGRHVKDSKKLIEELNINDRVIWVEPLPNRSFIRYIHACDATADQFHLGAFGSLTPKAMACAKPTLLHLNDELHRWAFSEMPPVLNVREPEEIAEALVKLYASPMYAREVGLQSRNWYEKYHSNTTICNAMLDCYNTILNADNSSQLGKPLNVPRDI